MNNTVFWSWQSDLPPSTTKDFIKGALVQALTKLTEELELEMANRLELDHDTKGEAGLVEIVTTIFRKIDDCEVFVADITPVAEVSTKTGTKKVPNPNVMIELGYALREVGHQRIITVANLAFGGKPEELPFDLRHRRGAITYHLDNANGLSTEKVRRELINQLVAALKTNLAAPREDKLIRNPMPLLSVETSDEMLKILEVQQGVQLEGVSSLDEVMSQTPIKTRADQQAPTFGFDEQSMRPFDLFSRQRITPFREWTGEELDGYNQRVRWYYDSYKKYLVKVEEYRLLLRRSANMRLVLVNRGTRPATDVWAKITFPEGFLVYEDDDLPPPPEAPTPPAFAPNGIGSPTVRMVPHSVDFLRKPRRITEDRRSLTFSSEKIQHGFQVSIKPFRVLMSTKEEIRSFAAAYQVSSDELPRQITDELHFEVKLVDE